MLQRKRSVSKAEREREIVQGEGDRKRERGKERRILKEGGRWTEMRLEMQMNKKQEDFFKENSDWNWGLGRRLGLAMGLGLGPGLAMGNGTERGCRGCWE